MRVAADGTWSRPTTDRRTLLAGSPLRAFRLTEQGGRLCDAIESGCDIARSSLVERLIDAGAIHPVPLLDRTDTPTVDVTVVTPQLGGTVRTDRDVTVDDGSAPPIPGATIRLEENRGPAAARNAGRRVVTTALIAFVDADVTIDDGEWLRALLPHFDDPRVGLVAPRVIGDPSGSLDLGDEPARVRAGSRVSYVPAAAIVVRAAAFDDVGGFDDTLRFGEDVDFVWRLDDAGWRCRYEPRSSVRHAPRPTVAARFRQQVDYGSSAAPLALRHPASLPPFRANGWMACSWVALLVGRPVLGALLAATNVPVVARSLPEVPILHLARLTLDAHRVGARQLASAIRRTWWPLAIVGCVFSKRARAITLAAFAIDPRAALTDVAYGWGVWRGMIERRTWRPIAPQIRSWSPQRRPARGRARPPAAAAR